MIPPEISTFTPSAAEKRLFQMLRSVTLDHATALHSVNLSEHAYKICGEIDFVIVSPQGLLVLEVKGGRIASNDGVWTFTDRFGRSRHKAESPFAQARSATFALKGRLQRLLPGGVDRWIFGWGGVFPDQTWNERSVEWADEMVIDAPSCASVDALQRAIVRLLRYWREKRPSQPVLEPKELGAVLQAIRPDFECVPSLVHRAEATDAVLSSLTDSQYRFLDSSAMNERVLCDGGAGTGKTFLAAEVARREVAAGRRVLVTCRSEILGRFLADQTDLDSPACTIAPLRNLSASGSRFDTLIVDEGQDVINVDDLAVLDGVLTGGIEKGRWRIFYDANNQAGLIGRYDEAALDLLLGGNPSRVHLPDNCRNTRDIVTQVQTVLGADIGVTTAGAGFPVLYNFWDTEEDEAAQLAKYLTGLLDGDVAPHHVTVLTRGPTDASCARLLPPKLRGIVEPLTSMTVTNPVRGRIGLAEIANFKGLENRFVCVCDIRTVDGAEALAQLYVGMTRARTSLWLGLHSQVKGDLRSLAATRRSVGVMNG